MNTLRRHRHQIWIPTVLLAVLALCLPAGAQEARPAYGGEMRIVGPDGAVSGVCPLAHTEVDADVAGFVARVTVRQRFVNPLQIKIEAVYVFPLPQNAAIDDMVMIVGDRRIRGQVKPREQARQIYQQARTAGHVAGLLDQERPNIFTQSVANIEPGQQVEIEISYIETLRLEAGRFEFVFPMVVGPRYMPGSPSGRTGTGWAQNTSQVPDGSRISPPVAPPDTRAGHDISISVSVDAGSELFDIASPSHEIESEARGSGRARITLKNKTELPNKDFILNYRTAGEKINDTFLVHTDQRGSYFTLALQPPRRIKPKSVVPRELIFVLDTSGSMSGFPIEKAKKVMSLAIDAMRPADTFNLITFAGYTSILWDKPRPNTDENREAAQAFLATRRGGGGTEMMQAIRAALRRTGGGQDRPLFPMELANLPADGRTVTVRVPADRLLMAEPGAQNDWGYILAGQKVRLPVTPFDVAATNQTHLITGEWRTESGRRVFRVSHAGTETLDTKSPIRIVCFMTDGYVGNDFQIIEAVNQYADTTRVFSFGIGSSVNRFLLDGMAHAGRGEVEYVTLGADADTAVKRFAERISAPVLTDITIDWGTLEVADVYPKRIPDLFSAKPIMVHGRLTGLADGRITLKGRTGEGAFERPIDVSPAVRWSKHEALASLWARAKVADLMNQDLEGVQLGRMDESLENEITALGTDYRLMTQFTSFVAVEEMTVTIGGEPTTIAVPVEIPEGVSYEGIFGDASRRAAKSSIPASRGGRGGAFRSAALQAGGSNRKAAAQRARGGATGTARQARTAVQGLAFDLQQLTRTPDVGLIAKGKLAEPLQNLADLVKRGGKDGDLVAAGVRVVKYRVDVMVYLSDLSDETLEALKEAGFVKTTESKAIRLLIGTIDVRKLEELSKLQVVVRITPVKGI